MFKLVSPLLVLLGILGGCAKEKSYDTQYKGNPNDPNSLVRPKASINEMCSSIEDPCVYVPSVANTPYAVTASRPFWQGDAKLVITKWTSKKLQFLQVEDDPRFNGNVNNLSPVLNIDVSHIDYKCTEDDYGDCTNKEEEDKEKDFSRKRSYKVKKIDVVETNSLPIDLGELFNKGCFTQTDSELTKYAQEDGALNITVKKTYDTAAKCATLREMADLRYLTFTVDYNYSIVKLSKLVDPNYKKASYPQQDEGRFGFFKTEIKKKTVDNHDHFMGLREHFINRWSPNKPIVDFYMNTEFFKPENKAILDATNQALESVNLALKKAESGIQIKLKPGKDSDIGDIRKNFIIFVKDPQASGVIGYGPSITNPRTGEILNARTVMYYGTIQKFVSRAYDELVDELRYGKNSPVQSSDAEASESSATEAGTADNHSHEDMVHGEPVSSYIPNLVLKPTYENQLPNINATKFMKFLTKNFDITRISQVDTGFDIMSLMKSSDVGRASVLKDLEDQTYFDLSKNLEQKHNTFEQKIAKMAEETFFHASHVDFNGAMVNAVKSDIVSAYGFAYWDQLTEEQRSEIMKKLLPYVWVPTLVHEFGHNLGLRHNFYGSVDKANYYTKSERAAMGLTKDVTYSSIMDYAPHTNNELMTMGKYDIAALKFGYARKVDLIDGKSVKIDGTLKDMISGGKLLSGQLKPYMYCSDEHVYSNALCNRFDDGDTNEKVVQYYINQYKKYYEKVNFRNRRYSYDSRSGDFSYLLRMFSTFSSIRQFFDQFDQTAFSGAYDPKKWEEKAQGAKDRLMDVKKASDLSFKFFKDLIEEPAYHCLEFKKDTGVIQRVLPFTEMAKGTQLEEYGITFDIKFGCLILNQEQFAREGMAYAQFGKYFNNSLDLLYDRSLIYQGDPSQIDVRGVWMDKVMATFFLASRTTVPTTIGAASSGNYFDYEKFELDDKPMYRGEIVKTLDDLLRNSITRPVEVMDGNGNKQSVPLTYTMEGNHQINKSYNNIVNYFFGLRKSRTNLKSVLVKFLKRQLSSTKEEGDIESDAEFADYQAYDVAWLPARTNVQRYNYDEVVTFKNSRGKINNRFGIYDYNEKGMWLYNMKLNHDLLKDSKSEVYDAAKIYKEADLLAERFGMEPFLPIDTLKKINQLKDQQKEYLKHVISITPDERTEADVAALADLLGLEQEPPALLLAMIVELINVGPLTKVEIENVEYMKALSSEFIDGMIAGSINDQVLLSSFKALRQK